jgi:hypothetical protein
MNGGTAMTGFGKRLRVEGRGGLVLLCLLALLTSGCAVRDHTRTQDLFNDAVVTRVENPAQSLALFERVKMRTSAAYPFTANKEQVSEPLIDLSGVGAFFGIVTTPEPDLKANAMYMLAESSLQTGDYETAKAAARIGLKEKNAGALDFVGMRLIQPRVIMREVVEGLGVSPVRFAPGSGRAVAISLSPERYTTIAGQLAEAYGLLAVANSEIDATGFALDVKYLPDREMVRLLRQWEVIITGVESDRTGLAREQQLRERQAAALQAAGIEGPKTLNDAYCQIRAGIDPALGEGVAWIFRDVDALLVGSTRTGRNPCLP